MMHHHLRILQFRWNHKKMYRICREMGLDLIRKHKKRLAARVVDPLLWPVRHNITWSKDFKSDTLQNEVSYRSLNIIDDINREGLNIVMDISLSNCRVIRELNQLIEWGG